MRTNPSIHPVNEKSNPGENPNREILVALVPSATVIPCVLCADEDGAQQLIAYGWIVRLPVVCQYLFYPGNNFFCIFGTHSGSVGSFACGCGALLSGRYPAVQISRPRAKSRDIVYALFEQVEKFAFLGFKRAQLFFCRLRDSLQVIRARSRRRR